jgi:hypothetical protein
MIMSKEYVGKAIDDLAKMQRNILISSLRGGAVNVIFTKKDGTERIMNCTLNEKFIPKEKAPKNTGKKESEDVIAVFDLDKNDWRSFRIENLVQFTNKI